MKFESWKLEQLAAGFHWKDLNSLLSSDPVLKVLRPKLIGSLLGPVSAPERTSNTLDAIRRLIQLLQDAGFTPGAFDAQELLDCDQDQINTASKSLFEKLIPLTDIADVKEQAIVPMENIAHDYHTGSSQYASAESEVNSDESIGITRMSLGPTGVALLRDHKMPTKTEQQSRSANVNPKGPSNLKSYFEAAMEKFVKDQQAQDQINHQANQVRNPPNQTERYMPDVDMESVGSHHGRSNEYDFDDLDMQNIRRPQVAAAETLNSGGFNAQRIRMSAIAELKEFSGRERDEDRARSWIRKVKSAFLRDQAPEVEKCLVFGDLLTGPAGNWFAQLSRSTRNSWKTLLEEFMVQYGGRGVSVGRQYYHARKRSEESPMEYLHRLNVAGIRAKIQIQDGPPDIRREHVEHFLETLDDRDLAKQLSLLRLEDASALQDTLRAYERTETRQGRASMGSSKFRQKSAAASAPVSSKITRAVKAIQIDHSESESESDHSGSEPEINQRVICTTATSDRAKGSNDQRIRQKIYDQDEDQDRDGPPKSCSHCGSTKHSDRGCWKRLTCQKCGRKGHPSDKCFFVCAACGDMHESGKCPMEEFYNMIRQWYVPTEHAGLFPPKIEEMLN